MCVGGIVTAVHVDFRTHWNCLVASLEYSLSLRNYEIVNPHSEIVMGISGNGWCYGSQLLRNWKRIVINDCIGPGKEYDYG